MTLRTRCLSLFVLGAVCSPAPLQAQDVPEIRTPPAPATPHINGPAIFGVRPNHPFFYHIPATGDRPMTFSVENLPAVLVHRFPCPTPGDVTCLFAATYGSLRCTCSQLLSEAALPENRGCPNPFLPDHWSRHVKSVPLHVISLARLACVHAWAWAAGSLDTRTGQKVVADNTR